MNPNSERDIDRLRKAIAASRRKLEPFRALRIAALKEYVGRNYSNDGAADKVPVNYIELEVGIFTRHLTARAPQVMCKTRHMQLKPRAAKFQLALNHLIQEIRLRDTLNKAVKNAMFSMGVIKTGINPSHTVEIGGVFHDVGQPFADSVDLDDFFFDMYAKHWEQISFCGDRYRLPLEKVRQIETYDLEIRRTLTKTDKNDSGDYSDGNERAEDLSGSKREQSNEDGEISDYVELEDVWLPAENLVITLACDSKIKKPLQIIEWDGPESGPYKRLGYKDVPNNIMPLSPVALWMDLHTLANAVWRKLGRQGLRQKEVTLYQSSMKDAMRRIQESSDGYTAECDNPAGIVSSRHGGIDQQMLMFGIQLRDQISYMGGNIESLGGLLPQAETLGQDQLLAQASSKLVQDMQDATAVFTKQIIEDIGFYLWNDPLIELPLTQRMPNSGVEYSTTFGQQDREGDFREYNIDIQPYSMQDRTPQQRMQTIMQLVTQLILPMQPQLAEQGLMVNFEGLLRSLAEYSDMSELEEIITFNRPPQSFQPGIVTPPATSSKPPVTTRNYVRTNRPGATTAGKNIGMLQTLMGSAQPKEAAGAMRPAE